MLKRRQPPRPPVPVPALDQEALVTSSEIWPTSWPLDPSTHFSHTINRASMLKGNGMSPYIIFVDPEAYVEWCRYSGFVVDSSESVVAYATDRLKSGKGVPWAPGLSMWDEGVLSIVSRSELGPFVRPWLSQTTKDRIVRPLSKRPLPWRASWSFTATAARYTDVAHRDLWDSFISAASDVNETELGLEVAPAYVSVQVNGGLKTWESSAIWHVLALAEAGTGFFGLSRTTGSGIMSLRVWSLSKNGVDEMDRPSVAHRLMSGR